MEPPASRDSISERATVWTSTRQRVVERLVDEPPDRVVTPTCLLRERAASAELPAALPPRRSAAAAGGLAELRATVNERPVIPA